MYPARYKLGEQVWDIELKRYDNITAIDIRIDCNGIRVLYTLSNHTSKVTDQQIATHEPESAHEA